jgi:hypothetical protein
MISALPAHLFRELHAVAEALLSIRQTVRRELKDHESALARLLMLESRALLMSAKHAVMDLHRLADVLAGRPDAA